MIGGVSLNHYNSQQPVNGFGSGTNPDGRSLLEGCYAAFNGSRVDHVFKVCGKEINQGQRLDAGNVLEPFTNRIALVHHRFIPDGRDTGRQVELILHVLETWRQFRCIERRADEAGFGEGKSQFSNGPAMPAEERKNGLGKKTPVARTQFSMVPKVPVEQRIGRPALLAYQPGKFG